ncbi:MAG TPA: hypothetical protein VFH09_03080 [Nitrososphaera sp.]|nr:hypothetical protein [Nitrososphaera sp.]
MSKKKRDDSYFAVDRRRKRKYMMIIIPLIIAVAIAGVAGAILYQPPTAMAISGIECNREEQLNYHIHSHLDVFVDGVPQQIPSNIGILSSPACLYWLHTHSQNGIIHAEAPETREFMLGQFLDIWQQTLANSTALFDSISDMPVTAYVDGERFEGDLRTIQLESLKEIVLAYGTPPENIPAAYDFGSITR